MLTRRRFLSYSALATAALRPSLWAESLVQTDQPAPHISRVPGRSTNAHMYSTPTYMR